MELKLHATYVFSGGTKLRIWPTFVSLLPFEGPQRVFASTERCLVFFELTVIFLTCALHIHRKLWLSTLLIKFLK